MKTESTDYLWDKYFYKKSDKEKNLFKAILDYNEIIDNIDEQIDEIEDALDKKLDYSIKLELEQLLIATKKKLEIYKDILDNKEKEYRKIYKSIEDFKANLDKFFINFLNFDMCNKRIIIDSIVDKIYVDKDKNGIDMEIIINPPQKI